MRLTRSFPFRFLLGLVLGVIILLLAAFNSLLIWVATGPRVLDELTPYIEEVLSAEDGSYRVTIDQTVLLWDGWRNPISVKLHDVKMLTAQGKAFSEFPEISMGVDIPHLMIGKIRPASLTINQPVISLLQREDKSIGFGYKTKEEEAKEETEPPSIKILFGIFSHNNRRLSELRLLQVTDGSISIGNKEKSVFFKAENTLVTFRRDHAEALEVKATSNVTYGEKQTPLSASLLIADDGKQLEGGVNFEKIIPAELETLFIGTDKLARMTVPISGGVQFTAHPEDETIDRLGFEISGGKGSFEDARLDGKLDFDRFEVRGEITDNLSKLNLQQFSADIDGSKVLANGTATLNPPYAIQGTVSAEQASAKHVRLFWPPGLAPISREWVTTNITAGEVPLATAKLNIQPGDLDKPLLPREAVDAKIQLRNGTIRYLPEHPAVSGINATVFIDGISLKADIESADFLEKTKLSAGKVDIPDLIVDNPRISVSFTAEAPASDAVHMLELPRLMQAEHLNLKRDMKGSVSAKAAIEFDFFAPRDEKGNLKEDDNVDYNVTATLIGIIQKEVMHKFDLQDTGGELHVENGLMMFAGKGIVNGADVASAKVKYLFKPEDGFDTFVTVEAIAPVGSLPRLGYPVMEFLEGEIGVKAEVKQGSEKDISSAELDLTATNIKDNALSWIKPAGKKASLTLTAEKTQSGLNIPEFKLKGPDADIQGKASLSPDMQSVSSLELGSSTLGGNKINSLVLNEEDGVINLTLKADELNLATYMKGDTSEFSFEKFPAINFNAAVKKLVLADGYPIDSFSGKLNCNKTLCPSADITGKIGSNKFQFQIIKNPTGTRQLSGYADNAGDFLRAIGTFQGMKDGKMSISGNYEKTAGNASELKARFIILDFTLVKAPVLAKILSMASLTGFFDTLQGNGIGFKKMNMPFSLKNDVLTIKDGKAYGPAIGITVDGTITMPGIVLDMDGTVVPSYTLNNTFSKVPLIGALLTGGGEGVFAARYSVKNHYKDPEVTVNPLSILAPGFLRNLFEVFEEPPEEKKE